MKTENTSDAEHDVKQWRAKPFIIGIVSFFLVMILIYAITGGLAVSWTHHVWPPNGPLIRPQSQSKWNAAAPQLEIEGTAGLKHLREVENQRLTTIRWTDDAHQYAAIPIDKAMSILAQADADHQLNRYLPEPKPATPIDLQKQKSSEAMPAPKLP